MTEPSPHKLEDSGEAGQRIGLTSFSIVLIGRGNNPSFINPDFLQRHEIVDPDLEVAQKDALISTPLLAQILFKGGLKIHATPERISFEQAGLPLNQEDIECPEIAKRYMEKTGHLSWDSVGIHVKVFIPTPDAEPERMSHLLADEGEWASFRDAPPEVRLKALYRYEQRTIQLDMGGARKTEKDGDPEPGILFHANFHRDINGVSRRDHAKKLFAVLEQWEKDLNDFYLLFRKFNGRRIGP